MLSCRHERRRRNRIRVRVGTASPAVGNRPQLATDGFNTLNVRPGPQSQVDLWAEMRHCWRMTPLDPYPLPPHGLLFELDGVTPLLALLYAATAIALPAAWAALVLQLTPAGRRPGFGPAALAKCASAPLAPALTWLLTALPVMGWAGLTPATLAFVRVGGRTDTGDLVAAMTALLGVHGLLTAGIDRAVLCRLLPDRPGLGVTAARSAVVGAVAALVVMAALVLNHQASAAYLRLPPAAAQQPDQGGV